MQKMRGNLQKTLTVIAISLIIVSGFTIVVGNPMEARNEDDNEDPDALYHEHVQGEASFENESEEEIESYSEEELERKREEALEEVEDTMVKALGLDDGPNFEDEQDMMEWFEELDEEELEELREYQLEQMPDSNGCGLTSYDNGPNQREDELEQLHPPIYPNGGVVIPPDAPCLDDSPDDHDTVQHCADAYYGWGLQYCRDCCFTNWMACGIRENSDEGWFDDNVPSFTIDDDEYIDCLEDEIVDISSSEAACMVGSTGGVAVATVAVALAGTGAPEPAISKATAAGAASAAIVYFTIAVVGGCAGGTFLSNWTDGINAIFCSVNALTWD